jgi:hypothetical protein
MSQLKLDYTFHVYFIDVIPTKSSRKSTIVVAYTVVRTWCPTAASRHASHLSLLKDVKTTRKMGLQKWKEINVYLLSSTTPFFVLLSSAAVRIGLNCARLFACLLLLVGNSIYTQRKNVAMPSSGRIDNHIYKFLLLNLQQNGNVGIPFRLCEVPVGNNIK